MSKTKQVAYIIRTLPAFRFEEKKGRLKTIYIFQTTFVYFNQKESVLMTFRRLEFLYPNVFRMISDK